MLGGGDILFAWKSGSLSKIRGFDILLRILPFSSAGFGGRMCHVRNPFYSPLCR